MFKKGHKYTRDEIHSVLGGSVEMYLPTKSGRVVYGAFTLNLNPDAPQIVLPGIGPVIEKTARIFAKQQYAIPVFIKRQVNKWEYFGLHKVKRLVEDRKTIAEHERRSGRPNQISMVLFLEEIK